MCKSVEGVNGALGQALDWAKWAATVALLPLLGTFAWAWWNHETRLHVISMQQVEMVGNRFTSGDGLLVWREIAAIRTEIEGKAAAIGATPVREDISEIKSAMREQSREMDVIRVKLSELSTKLDFVRQHQISQSNGMGPDITVPD